MTCPRKLCYVADRSLQRSSSQILTSEEAEGGERCKIRVKKSPGLILFSGLLCAFSLFGGVAQAETLIPDTEAAQHVGQAVAVEGTITRVFRAGMGTFFSILAERTQISLSWFGSHKMHPRQRIRG